MAIKYLDAKRLQGTNAERLALTTGATQHCQDTGTDEMGFGSNYIFANVIGADNSVVGSNTTALKVYMKKFLSPTGTIYAEVYNSAGVLQHEYGEKNITTLDPSTVIAVTFDDFPYDSPILEGDRVGIRSYNQAGSGVPVMTRNPSLTDPDWERIEYNGSSWTVTDTQSMRMCLTASEVSPSLPNGTIFNETDAYKYFMFNGTDTWNQMVSS